VSLLLQILVTYAVASLTIGLLLGIMVGRLLRRGDRRREHEVALLARSRAMRAVGSRSGSPPSGHARATRDT
jgi:NhaP-type Na+/H+ or K+/H+ antiporter